MVRFILTVCILISRTITKISEWIEMGVSILIYKYQTFNDLKCKFVGKYWCLVDKNNKIILRV